MSIYCRIISSRAVYTTAISTPNLCCDLLRTIVVNVSQSILHVTERHEIEYSRKVILTECKSVIKFSEMATFFIKLPRFLNCSIAADVK